MKDFLYAVLKVHTFYKAQWLSWLERRPVTAEVDGSSPFWVVNGILAQLGEHLPYKQRVTGSSPVGPICICGYGGIGRHKRLKISRRQLRAGSSPATRILLVCGYGGIGRRARFRFWFERVQVQILLPA